MTAGSRRTFLAGVGAAVGAAAAVVLPAAAARAQGPRLRLITTYVAGIGRHGPSAAARNLNEGAAVTLRREPENRYDPRAVAVWTKAGDKLGYVPRIDNQALANLMDAGLGPQARVLSVASGGGRPEVGILVELSLA